MIKMRFFIFQGNAQVNTLGCLTLVPRETEPEAWEALGKNKGLSLPSCQRFYRLVASFVLQSAAPILNPRKQA